MKLAWRFLKRHGRRLAGVGIAGVVFVLFSALFARAIGHVPRYAWMMGTEYYIYHVSADGQTLITSTRLSQSEILEAASPNVIVDFFEPPVWDTAQVWDCRTGTIRNRIDVKWPEETRLSPDGRFLVVPLGEVAHCANIVDLQTGNVIASLTDYQGYWNSARHNSFCSWFSPDSRLLVYEAGETGPSQTRYYWVLWDVVRRQKIVQVDCLGPGPQFAFSADSRTLAVAEVNDKETVVEIWDVGSDVPTGQRRATLKKTIWRQSDGTLFLSPNGDTLGYLSVDVESTPATGRVNMWNIERRQPVRAVDLIQPETLWPTYSQLWLRNPDGRTMWVSETSTPATEKAWARRWFEALFRPYALKADSQLGLFDAETGDWLSTIPVGLWRPVRSPHTGMLATHYDDGTVAIWDVPPRRPVPLILLLAAMHTALVLVPFWWFARRR